MTDKVSPAILESTIDLSEACIKSEKQKQDISVYFENSIEIQRSLLT